jgi:uridine kinase
MNSGLLNAGVGSRTAGAVLPHFIHRRIQHDQVGLFASSSPSQALLLSHSPSVRFERRIKPEAQKAVQDKVNTFAKGLSDLVAGDQKEAEPVFERMNQLAITQQIKKVLERQIYQAHDHHPAPMMIGMSGGSNSGKSTVMNQFLSHLQSKAVDQHGWKADKHGPVVDTLELDHFYKNFAESRKTLGDERFFGETNLDEPNALETKRFLRALKKIKQGHAVRTPIYSFLDSSRSDGLSLKVPAPFFVFEGLFALSHQSVRNLADLKIFINCDQETRSKRFWARAPQRNIRLDQSGWNLFNKTMAMHNQHVQPTESHADIVINGARSLASIEGKLTTLAELMVNAIYPGPNLHEQVDTKSMGARLKHWLLNGIQHSYEAIHGWLNPAK